LVAPDDAKKLIKIDSDAESDASSVGAFSPRTAPRSERDILSDNGDGVLGEINGKAQGEEVQIIDDSFNNKPELNASMTDPTSRSSVA